MRLLVSKGIPMGLQMFVVSSSMVALTLLVNRFGSQETAAFNAAMQLWNYVQMPALAICRGRLLDGGAKRRRREMGSGGRVATTGVTFNFLIGGALILADLSAQSRGAGPVSAAERRRRSTSRRTSMRSFSGRMPSSVCRWCSSAWCGRPAR